MNWFVPGPVRPVPWRTICLPQPAPVYSGFKDMPNVTYNYTDFPKGKILRVGPPEIVQYKGESRSAFRVLEREIILYVFLRDVADRNLLEAVRDYRKAQREKIAAT